ncbi:hypothetical protein FHR99_003197 [Litorivivens lipolytica]|uniref:Uncharacterized protein n=1 Tax=Litorivivens lipolytica TaxID=1524264 RepID=A0A7W4W7H5_9GAMM|nr:hypothetical protein [Litorivivens lipolytica]MBB3048923.1 hypothetical protein [Litorivivens lipolytica]
MDGRVSKQDAFDSSSEAVIKDNELVLSFLAGSKLLEDYGLRSISAMRVFIFIGSRPDHSLNYIASALGFESHNAVAKIFYKLRNHQRGPLVMHRSREFLSANEVSQANNIKATTLTPEGKEIYDKFLALVSEGGRLSFSEGV